MALGLGAVASEGCCMQQQAQHHDTPETGQQQAQHHGTPDISLSASKVRMRVWGVTNHSAKGLFFGAAREEVGFGPIFWGFLICSGIL